MKYKWTGHCEPDMIAASGISDSTHSKPSPPESAWTRSTYWHARTPRKCLTWTDLPTAPLLVEGKGSSEANPRQP